MRKINNSFNTFFSLLRAGLWESEANLSQYGEIDFARILKLAEDQSVVGIVTAGLERVQDVKVPQEIVLQFVGRTLQVEQRNNEMNYFVGQLVEKMRLNGIYVILVKGQGIAQCYERPIWRECGDIDLLLSEDNYEKTKGFLLP